MFLWSDLAVCSLLFASIALSQAVLWWRLCEAELQGNAAGMIIDGCDANISIYKELDHVESKVKKQIKSKVKQK